mgnify:CR=1 FL=1|jgi:hypothetical protein
MISLYRLNEDTEPTLTFHRVSTMLEANKEKLGIKNILTSGDKDTKDLKIELGVDLPYINSFWIEFIRSTSDELYMENDDADVLLDLGYEFPFGTISEVVCYHDDLDIFFEYNLEIKSYLDIENMLTSGLKSDIRLIDSAGASNWIESDKH